MFVAFVVKAAIWSANMREFDFTNIIHALVFSPDIYSPWFEDRLFTGEPADYWLHLGHCSRDLDNFELAAAISIL